MNASTSDQSQNLPAIGSSPTDSRLVDRRIALLLFAATIAIYLRMLAPGLLSGDSGEFQFAAWRLGLAHATGYPLYLLLGWGWQHLLSFVRISPATALNAFSAVAGAASIALFYQLLLAWLPGIPLVRRLTALFAALFFAFNPTFWSQNLIAEVYTLHVLLLLLICWQFRKLSRGDRQGIQPAILAFFFGLGLTHHASTLFLAPGVLIALSLAAPGWWKQWRTLVASAIGLLVPLLLYFYIPLRSDIDASPWYYLHLADENISLYGSGWQGFLDFVTGRSISVGFKNLPEAIGTLSQAWTLWKIHFGWIGLTLMTVGLIALFHKRTWIVLALTLPFALILQLFNLFYNIGDILVYYIPLYWVGTIWMAFGALAIGEVSKWGGRGVNEKHTVAQGGSEERKDSEATLQPSTATRSTQPIGVLITILLFLLPMQNYREYQPVLNQAGQDSARPLWQTILAAKPEPNAILVSNDRNEIVPLYYLQHVENFATSLTGLFPLITPDPSFADIGTTVERALQSGQPVYLVKPMPGLELRFDLEAANPPLVRVLGPAIHAPPQHSVEALLGPLLLAGYDWQQNGDVVQIDLYWRVQEKLGAKYKTTVQLFDETGEKIAQGDDSIPGGDFYPTTLWKPAESLRDRHALRLQSGKKPVKLLVGMYDPTNMTALSAPLEIKLEMR